MVGGGGWWGGGGRWVVVGSDALWWVVVAPSSTSRSIRSMGSDRLGGVGRAVSFSFMSVICCTGSVSI